jgi:hypothetical protein
MTASKDQCHLALPDLDPSIALAQAARQDFERPTVHQLIEQAKREHAEFTVALLWRSGAWLKLFFVPVHIQDSGVIVVKHKHHP